MAFGRFLNACKAYRWQVESKLRFELLGQVEILAHVCETVALQVRALILQKMLLSCLSHKLLSELVGDTRHSERFVRARSQ